MPTWHTSTIHTLKKSKFKGFCIPIANSNEIPNLIKHITSVDKNIAKSTHPTMYAWKTSDSNVSSSDKSPIIDKISNLNQGFNDCNESGAGLRLLGMLDRIHLVNILVVVTRWYGGTPLGPARFKCISDVGMESLENGGFLKFKSEINNNKKWIDCVKLKA